MPKREGQRGKRKGRRGPNTKTLPLDTYGEIWESWKARAIESSPLRDETAREALAEALATCVVTLRVLREKLVLGELIGEEVAKIPSVAGRVKQLCEALHISAEVEDEEDEL